MTLLYDGFHKIEAVNATVNGRQKQYEKLHLKSAVAGLVVNDEGYVCLVEQYRPAVGEFTLEIPAGLMDKPGLTEQETLIEELQEECLIDPNDVFRVEGPISHYYMIVGSSDATCSIYYVKVKSQSERHLQNVSDEVSAIHWFGSRDVIKLLEDSKIKDPKTIIAINHFLHVRILKE